MSLIKQFLPKDLWEIAWTFDIPDEFLQEDVDLIVLILKSKSIESKEDKQNWFNLLALMTSEQIEKLRNILIKERKKIEEIEAKYEKKKVDIKKKFLEKWQEMWYMKKVDEIHEKEWKLKTEEEEEAEKLLDMI